MTAISVHDLARNNVHPQVIAAWGAIFGAEPVEVTEAAMGDAATLIQWEELAHKLLPPPAGAAFARYALRARANADIALRASHDLLGASLAGVGQGPWSTVAEAGKASRITQEANAEHVNANSRIFYALAYTLATAFARALNEQPIERPSIVREATA